MSQFFLHKMIPSRFFQLKYYSNFLDPLPPSRLGWVPVLFHLPPPTGAGVWSELYVHHITGRLERGRHGGVVAAETPKFVGSIQRGALKDRDVVVATLRVALQLQVHESEKKPEFDAGWGSASYGSFSQTFRSLASEYLIVLSQRRTNNRYFKGVKTAQKIKCTPLTSFRTYDTVISPMKRNPNLRLTKPEVNVAFSRKPTTYTYIKWLRRRRRRNSLEMSRRCYCLMEGRSFFAPRSRFFFYQRALCVPAHPFYEGAKVRMVPDSFQYWTCNEEDMVEKIGRA